MPYIDVLIRNTLGKVFTYFIEEKGVVGRYVDVPLQRRGSCLGLVIEEKPDGYVPEFKTKGASLIEGDHRLFDEVNFKLARDIAAHAFCSYGEALELFMYNLRKSNRKLKKPAKLEPEVKELTADQMVAADRIWSARSAKGVEAHEFLLYGVTSSGKTEVYFELIRRAIAEGKKALFLVPEIALTPQMTKRIARAFSDSKIAVIHSKVTEAKRAESMAEIASENVDIVLGARSAVLTPLRNIGIIIIDECHETSYAQENRPRYDAIRVARKLAELEGATMVLGSATPPVDFYYRHSADGTLITLDRRYGDYALPNSIAIDMRHESDKFMSSQLDRAIKDRLEKGEQTIIFLNRKGFSSIVQCERCGHVFKCPNCDVVKTYYKKDGVLCCNYCRHVERTPKSCPDCGSEDLSFSGLGTEKVEAELKKRYPTARVARMDRETMTTKNKLEELTRQMEAGEIDIVVGTQMIAKGLDFPKVTLVGILNADLQLYRPDYKASERAYQLFTQVSGRAGRSGLHSEVIIQTFSPTHSAIESRDYLEFYRSELRFRERLGYPPYKSVALMTFVDVDRNKAHESAARAKNYLRKKIKAGGLDKDVTILDEVPSPIRRIENQYRFQLFVVSENDAFEEVLRLIEEVEMHLENTTKTMMMVDISY